MPRRWGELHGQSTAKARFFQTLAKGLSNRFQTSLEMVPNDSKPQFTAIPMDSNDFQWIPTTFKKIKNRETRINTNGDEHAGEPVRAALARAPGSCKALGIKFRWASLGLVGPKSLKKICVQALIMGRAFSPRVDLGTFPGALPHKR
jgi:hypothetical protein